MVAKINKRILLVGCVVIFIITTIFFILDSISTSSKSIVAGGILHPSLHIMIDAIPVTNQYETSSERFHRPSKQQAYTNPYSITDFQTDKSKPSLITKKFETPEDLILAYYGILRDASNMLGYSGGCGTIGWTDIPYPYAYELLTKEKQNEMSLNQFINSFNGIGYITLLKLVPAYSPSDTPVNIKYYMVEIEVITGAKARTETEYHQGSLFGYYYGLVAAEKTTNEGWKIKDTDYIAEDFLCAPMHSWFYLSDAVVQIVYGDNLKIIEKIDKTEQKGDMIYIYASGNGKQYRFDFIRITNGYDILLYENICENDQWHETSLLTDKWEYLKLSVENKDFNK